MIVIGGLTQISVAIKVRDALRKKFALQAALNSFEIVQFEVVSANIDPVWRIDIEGASVTERVIYAIFAEGVVAGIEVA